MPYNATFPFYYSNLHLNSLSLALIPDGEQESHVPVGLLRRVLSGLSIVPGVGSPNTDGRSDQSPPKLKSTISSEMRNQPQPSVAAGGSSSTTPTTTMPHPQSHQMFADGQRIECFHQTSKSWIEGVVSGYHEDDGTYNLEVDINTFFDKSNAVTTEKSAHPVSEASEILSAASSAATVATATASVSAHSSSQTPTRRSTPLRIDKKHLYHIPISRIRKITFQEGER